jgi:hypothetical protein
VRIRLHSIIIVPAPFPLPLEGRDIISANHGHRNNVQAWRRIPNSKSHQDARRRYTSLALAQAFNPFNVLLNADCHVYQTIHVDQRIVPKPNKVFVEHVSVNALEWQTGLG